jgi:hypothetical protein
MFKKPKMHGVCPIGYMVIASNIKGGLNENEKVEIGCYHSE